MKQIQGRSGGDKTWNKCSKNKGETNKSQSKQQINKKSNGTGDTKNNNRIHIFYSKWICLCNKGCGFNTSHNTGFHYTWNACVKNNQPFSLPDTHVFQNKMVAADVIRSYRQTNTKTKM